VTCGGPEILGKAFDPGSTEAVGWGGIFRSRVLAAKAYCFRARRRRGVAASAERAVAASSAEAAAYRAGQARTVPDTRRWLEWDRTGAAAAAAEALVADWPRQPRSA
jgi:hypothetical protein